MEKTEQNIKKDQQVIRSASAMSLGTLGSRVLGLLRDILLASLFSRTVTDAFVVAFRLPNMFRRLLGEGSLSVSFIPVFLETKAQKGQESAQNLASSVMTLLWIITSGLTVLGIFWMESLLGLLVSGESYLSVPGKMEQTVFLARILFGYLFLVTTYAYFMALLNALKYFLIPALAPAVFNFVFILFILMPQSWGRTPGEMLSWGVIAGGIFQVLMVSIQLIRLGYLPKLGLKITKPLKTVLINMIPGAIGLGVLQLMSLANVYYASHLAEGTHSYIYWADRVLELPQSLLAVSLGAALLPTLSQLWVQGQKEEMIRSGQNHLRLILFLTLPSAVGLFVLADPIVKVLYMRGAFNEADAQVTSSVVRLYSFLLLASSFVKVMVPSFYAIKNTWLPAVTSVGSLLLHIVLAPLLMQGWGVQGLVGSTVISGFFNMTLLFIAYHFMIGPFSFFSWVKGVAPFLVPVSLMGLVAHYGFSFFFLTRDFMPMAWARGVALGLAISLCIGFYFFICYRLKIEEAKKFISAFQRKI